MLIGPHPADGGGYVEVAVRFAAAGDGVEARVETRAGDAEWQPVAVPLTGGETAELAHRALLDASVPGRGDEPARRLGEALFTGLFHGQALERYRAAQGFARTAAPPVRLRFHLGAGSAAERALHRLPWELLCEPGSGGGRLLALDRRLSVVRHLPIGDGVPPMARPPRLRVLVAAAEGRAPGTPPLDFGGEIDAIRAACPPGGAVEVEVLRLATMEALIARLREGRFHVLHLIGHGDLSGRDGVLLLPEPDGRLVPCRGEQFATQIGGLSPLRLVVLNACRTAEAVADRPFAGIATALLAHGLPAAVAMQAPITDAAAARFAATLYARLAAGAGLDAAVAEGRLAIARARPRTFEWAVPVLFSRLPDGELFARPEPTPFRRVLPVAAAGAALVVAAFVGLQAGIDGSGGRSAEDVATAAGRGGSDELEEEAGRDPGRGQIASPPLEITEGKDSSPTGDGIQEKPLPDSPLVLSLVPGAADEEPPPAPPSKPGPVDRRPPWRGRSDAGVESALRSVGEMEASILSSMPVCGEAPLVLRSGESAFLPELSSHLLPQVGEWPDLGPYLTLSVLGGSIDLRRAVNRTGNVDYRPDIPLVVSVLGIDHPVGTVRLSCRIVSRPR